MKFYSVVVSRQYEQFENEVHGAFQLAGYVSKKPPSFFFYNTWGVRTTL